MGDKIYKWEIVSLTVVRRVWDPIMVREIMLIFRVRKQTDSSN